MTATDEYAARVALALEGLLPIAWMERLGRCADPRRPTRDELWPDDREREAVVEVLVMADVLAAGAEGRHDHKRRGTSLAALAKGLVLLSLAPGGVRQFMGLRIEAVEQPGGWLRLEVTTLATQVRDAVTREQDHHALLDSMRRAGLEGF